MSLYSEIYEKLDYGVDYIIMDADCIICDAQVEYLSEDELLECVLCGKKENACMVCSNGHYVCNECHMKGVTKIFETCLKENTTSPYNLLNKLMQQSFCHMHGPEHHIMVGSAILTAYKNAGGQIKLEEALKEQYNRSKKVPGGTCGYWGACGAAISAGIAVSIITKSTPLTQKEFQLANMMTSRALEKIAQHGGPRCCKRDSFLTINTAINHIKENLNIQLEKTEITCQYSKYNKECIKTRCPFTEETK